MLELTPVNPRDITDIAYRNTRYEVTIDGIPVAYIAKKTKQALLNIARANSDYIIEKMEDPDSEWDYTKQDGFNFHPVIVNFSGRTERDAALMSTDYTPPNEETWAKIVDERQPSKKPISEIASFINATTK